MEDENNPQREEVLSRERNAARVAGWLQLRIQAALTDAAAIAVCPDIKCTPEQFVQLAGEAYELMRQQLAGLVARISAAKEQARTDSPTTATNENEEKKS